MVPGEVCLEGAGPGVLERQEVGVVGPDVPEEPLEVRKGVGGGVRTVMEESKVPQDQVEVLVGQQGLHHVGPVQAVHAVGPEHTLLLTVLRHTLKTKKNT